MKELSPIQIAEAFPECSALIKKKLSRLESHAMNAKMEIVRISATYDENTAMFLTEVYKFFILDKIKKETARLKRILSIMKPSTSKNKITQRHIESARNIEINSLFDFGKMRRGSKSSVTICPFHDEKTPSFHIYKTNTFHCYGCGISGDAIDFIKRLYKKDFIEAVKFLNQGRNYES